MVEVAVLGKGLESKLTVGLFEATEHDTNKLHAANGAEKLSNVVEAGVVLGLEGNVVVGNLDLDVLRRDKVVDLAKELSSLGAQSTDLVELAQENEDLVASEAGNIRSLGHERL